jgi:outer membrane receptor protein involved in Fe transport
VQFEGQTDRSFRQDRVQVVAGASAVVERIDSFDEELQRQSLVFEPIRSNQEALFGQVEWTVAGPLRLALAGRGDFSSLHDFQFSPKASAVYTFAANHRVRLTYNEAFQVPNSSEFFLQADAAAPVNLGALNAFCTPVGIDCGFGPTRVLAVGNRDLQLERTRTVEVGYKGLIVARALLTVDYHRTRASKFISDLLPQIGTPLGRINSNFGPWEGPAGLPAAVTAQVRAAAPASLSNNLDGLNILAVVSYTNFGRVDTQGADVAFDYMLPGGWRGAVSYSWFDFDLRDPIRGLETMVLPNTPKYAGSIAFGYARARLDAMFAMRWVDAFRWSVGPFQGDVESYATADATANYRLIEHLTVGLNVANVFDRKHWETFGGDVLRRRALVSVGYLW